MLKKLILILMLVMLSLGTLTACETMGKWTGEGVEEVEEGAEDFEKGYERGKS